jgi:uncharacterized NAD-dependent epimerase/dehydratase family protein
MVGAQPNATIVCHRPNHPYRYPRGIEYEIRAIEAVEPTKVVGISLNLRNVKNKSELKNFQEKYDLPVADIKNGGAFILLNKIIDHLGIKFQSIK